MHLSSATGGARACLSFHLGAALTRADLANWFDQLRTGLTEFSLFRVVVLNCATIFLGTGLSKISAVRMEENYQKKSTLTNII